MQQFINIDNSFKIIFKNERAINFNKCKTPEIYPLENYFNNNITINSNSVLILETYTYHYECTPGFAKYFIDLGFNVDIVIHRMGITSFCYFESINKIRLFFYENAEDIIKKEDNFISLCKKYDYRLIETTEPNNIKLYKKINSNQTFFVIHVLEFLNLSFFYNFFNKNQILCLANFSIGTKINPHYFGEFRSREKNRITTFFITSTIKRNYSQLITASKKLKEENNWKNKNFFK